jgi:cytochrome c biogenesis protein CcmG/thiol:disulfide interchange protein DsbE
MLKQWTAVAIGVGLLAMMSPVWPLESEAAQGAACDPNAKTANLNFTLKDMNGKNVSLSAYKGKVLLVDFWATWCGPCKVEIPGFVDLYTRYRGQGFEIVGVLVDDQIAKAKPFAQQFKMNYPVLDGDKRDDVKDAFGPLWGLPTAFLIGRDGKICKKHSGFATKEQFEKEIKALL